MSAREEAIQIARELAGCPRAERFDRFFARIRDSRIPYLACQPGVDPERLYGEIFEALFMIGSASVPLAVGLTMHQYVLSALATMPIREPTLERASARLLAEIEERRLLLAIGSVGDNIRKKDRASDMVRVEECDGGLFAEGRIHFQSMASRADLLGFIGARSCGELGFYVVETGDPGVRVGDRIFSDAMAEADTRWMDLDGVRLSEREIVTADDELTRITMFYGTAWFEALIPAAYLGGAARALDEAGSFAKAVALPDGTSLAELDGAKVELGRLAIQLEASLGLVPGIGRAFAELSTGDPVRAIERVTQAASVAKYTSTRAAEEIVQGARRFVGTRGMRPGAVIEELSQQVFYGPLHPKLTALLERGLGDKVLGLDSVTYNVRCL